MILLQLQVINSTYVNRAATRVISLIFIGYISVHLGVLSPVQAMLWLGACLLVEAGVIGTLRHLMSKHAAEVDLATPVDLRGVKILTALTCWLAAIPAVFTPLHPIQTQVFGVLLCVGGLIGIASQRDMRRWTFLTNAPIFAGALIANLFMLATPENRWVFLVLGAVFIANTVTASVTTSMALNGLVESRMDAARANLAKSMFVARMGHEIRTPLNGVLGVADLMAMEDLPPRHHAHLELIRQSGRALLSLLNDLLDFSKIEAGKLTLTPTPQNLRLAVEPACAAFGIMAQEKGLSFQSDLAAIDAYFNIDGPRVGQIIQNFLSNAVKFTDLGEIRLSSARVENTVIINVTDTGPGITDDEMPRLFREFSQIEHSGRLKAGTGLGLSICSQLAKLMGGEVTCTSAKGAGSTFTLTLPVVPLSAPVPEAPVTALAFRERTHAKIRPETRRDEAQAPALRVLVAEDHPTNQIVISGLLANAGCDFHIAPNGHKVVEAWRVGDWDLVLMDIQMPVMDGLAATRLIRSLELSETRPRTPIYGFSADAMSHQVAEQLAAGLDGHLQKPVQIEALFQLLGDIERSIHGRSDPVIPISEFVAPAP